MKDSASSGIEGFLPLQGPSFQVLAGSANFLFPAMLGGSPGGTVSLANSFPQLAVRAVRGYGRARDEADGRAAAGAGQPHQRARSPGAYGVAGVKAAMDLAGFRRWHPAPAAAPARADAEVAGAASAS